MRAWIWIYISCISYWSRQDRFFFSLGNLSGLFQDISYSLMSEGVICFVENGFFSPDVMMCSDGTLTLEYVTDKKVCMILKGSVFNSRDGNSRITSAQIVRNFFF